MTTSCHGRTGLAVLVLLAPGVVRPVPAAPQPGTPAGEAYDALYRHLDAGDGPLRTKWEPAALTTLCERWVEYARAAGLPESPQAYVDLLNSIPAGFQKTDYYESMAVSALLSNKQPCPPPSAGAGATATAPTPSEPRKPEGNGGSKRTLLVGGGVAALGAAVALGAGGGSDPTPAAPPPTTLATIPLDVTALHGAYTGRLTTGPSSIPGCGRAAVAPCNTVVAGNSTGTMAVVTFGGDLPNTGVLRPDGALQNLRFEGAANGLGALDGGLVILWQQQGTIANNTLTLNGTVLVRSDGPCNGATFTTLVEGRRN